MVLLLNWLWMGTLLAAAVAASLACTRRLNAATRERIWWITLVAVMLLPFAGLVAPAAGPRPALLSSALPGVAPVVQLQAQPPVWAALAWAGLAALAAFRVSRLAISVLRLRRARASARPFPLALERRLRRWNGILSADASTAPRLVLSTDVHHAAVLGFGPHLIAIAPDAAARLDADELDQVVVHEYAHVCRRDPAGILVQRLISALAGFHPAVWWIDRALTLEREVACDDWVLAHATLARAYGSCLVKLAEGDGRPGWSPAPGALSGSQLGRRVERLLDPVRDVSTRRSRPAIILATLAIGLAGLLGTRLPLVGLAGMPPLLQSLTVHAGFGALPSRAVSTAIASQGARIRGIPSSNALLAVGDQGVQAPVLLEAGWQSGTAPLDGVSAVQLPPSFGTAVDRVAIPASIVGLEAVGETTPPGAGEDPETDAAAAIPSDAQDEGRSPWMRLADAGTAAGGHARDSGVRTGGFFARVGRSIGSAF